MPAPMRRNVEGSGTEGAGGVAAAKVPKSGRKDGSLGKLDGRIVLISRLEPGSEIKVKAVVIVIESPLARRTGLRLRLVPVPLSALPMTETEANSLGPLPFEAMLIPLPLAARMIES